ncbi:MAG: prepilin-type N-terminal cleavage/methylation domain-containing protein [Eubacterium sp.]|nr:prepilin-type N-terminal cleavage/methylation domain-containing protein [Eubacterium sp.]
MKKKFLKLKKGFTLVEMIIAMAITALLCGSVMMLFGSVSNIIKSLNDDVFVNTTTDSLTNYLFTRMVTSTNFSISINNVDADGNITASESQNSVNNLLAERDNPAIENLYGMVIVNGKLYDLGVIESYDMFSNKISNLDKYRLFNDNYYGDVHYGYTFSVESPTGATADQKWYRVGVIPFDENGEALMSERSEMFKLINLQYSKFTPSIDGAFYTTNPTDGTTVRTSVDTGIVILYRIKDYSKVTAAPSLTE